MATAEVQGTADFEGTKRFQVVRRIGAGGMGVVYEAIDRERAARVALKTLRTWTADAFLRFKDEFRALQDLHHPNLVALGELLEDGGQWFFTMELIDGVPFLTWVNGAIAPAAPAHGAPSFGSSDASTARRGRGGGDTGDAELTVDLPDGMKAGQPGHIPAPPSWPWPTRRACAPPSPSSPRG